MSASYRIIIIIIIIVVVVVVVVVVDVESYISTITCRNYN
jgi:hypothetical protein